MAYYILSFFAGVVITAIIAYLIHSKASLHTREELITLKAKINSTEDLQEIIKRDFVQLANETIKKAGKQLMESIADKMKCFEVPINKTLASNPASMNSAKTAPYSKAFWQDYGKFPLLKLLRWYNYPSWWKSLINLFPNWRHNHISDMVPDSRP